MEESKKCGACCPKLKNVYCPHFPSQLVKYHFCEIADQHYERIAQAYKSKVTNSDQTLYIECYVMASTDSLNYDNNGNSTTRNAFENNRDDDKTDQIHRNNANNLANINL